jgi:hypothetical protein
MLIEMKLVNDRPHLSQQVPVSSISRSVSACQPPSVPLEIMIIVDVLSQEISLTIHSADMNSAKTKENINI